MKKLYYLIMSIVILGLVFAGCGGITNITAPGTTETEGVVSLTRNGEDPKILLYAGQDILVGEVIVTDDGENLCVQYQLSEEAIADGWRIYETHLDVATSFEGLHTNKSGNPQPGQFPYGDDELEGVESWPDEPICISLKDIGANCDDPLYIAAHAVVKRLVPDCRETVWQIGDVETLGCEEGTQLTNYADEFNWGSPADPCIPGPSLVWSMPGYANPFVIGTNLDSEFPYNSNASTAYSYATNFDVQWDGELPFGGKLILSWSPGKSATEKKLISDGFEPATLTAVGTTITGAGWFMNKYPLVQDVILVDPVEMGIHTINFQHTLGDGTFWDWIRLERPCVEEETAWGFGYRFVDQGNWATFFTYTVECPVCLGCPDILAQSDNIEVLVSPPSDVSVNALVSDDYIRVWKEFEGPLPSDLYYDLAEGVSARSYNLGDQLPEQYIAKDVPVCIFYVHYDQIGDEYTDSLGIDASITFGEDILGLIISGGTKGTFANRDLMFDADDSINSIGNPSTTYPDISDSNNHERGLDVKWVQNTDDAKFTGGTVDFNVWVANAHDSFRVILPMVPVPCEE